MVQFVQAVNLRDELLAGFVGHAETVAQIRRGLHGYQRFSCIGTSVTARGPVSG